MPLFRRLACLLPLLVLAACGEPVIDCGVTMVTQMPLHVEDNLLVVPAGINGHKVRLIVDTGAERTTISDAVAERLGLPHDARHVVRSTGVGGTTVAPDVKLDRLVLGDKRFPVDRIAVGSFKLQNDRGLDADGLLGSDILLAFDMDIDVPDGTLTLYRSGNCPDRRPPWTERAIEIPGVAVRRDRLMVPFTLDGLGGMALIDTGAQGNILGLDMARRIGLNEQALQNDPPIRQLGIGPAIVLAHLHRFGRLQIGPITQDGATMTVLPSQAGFGDALFGEQFLQGRRVWLSFHSRQIFVSMRPGEP